MNISSTEILIVLVVALIVLGPQRLPDAMKTAGKAYREFRKVSGTVQREINEVVNETTGMFTSTADVISGKSPTTQSGAATKPANASFRPADELPADEMPAIEAHADAADAADALPVDSPNDAPPDVGAAADELPVTQAAKTRDSPADVADELTA